MKIVFIFVAMVVVAVGTAVGLGVLFPRVAIAPENNARISLEQVLQQTLTPAPIPPGNELSPLGADELAEFDATDARLSEDLSEDLDVALADENVDDLESLYQASLNEAPASASADPAVDVEPSPEPTAAPTPAAVTAAAPAPTPTAVTATPAPPRPTTAPTPRATPAPTPRVTPPPVPPATPPPTAAPRAAPPVAQDERLNEAWWVGAERDPQRLAVVYVGSAAYTRAIVVMGDGPFADAAATGRHLRVMRDGQTVSGQWQIAPQNPQMLVFPVADVGVYELGIAEGLADRNGRRYGVSRSGPIRVR